MEITPQVLIESLDPPKEKPKYPSAATLSRQNSLTIQNLTIQPGFHSERLDSSKAKSFKLGKYTSSYELVHPALNTLLKPVVIHDGTKLDRLVRKMVIETNTKVNPISLTERLCVQAQCSKSGRTSKLHESRSEINLQEKLYHRMNAFIHLH